MQGFLVIDKGNTRIKATWLPDNPGVDAEHLMMEEFDFEALEAFASDKAIAGIGIVAVSSLAPSALNRLECLWPGKVLHIGPDTPFAMTVDYDDSRTLGIDRKATALAASCLHDANGMLVVDAGTALTMDVVKRDRFLGGNISPGLTLRFESLRKNTALLPRVEISETDAIPYMGSSTRTAIIAGVVAGMGWEISGAIRWGASTHGISKVLFTGGDGLRMMRVVQNLDGEELEIKRNIEFEYDPDLLAKGVREMYNRYEANC